MIYDVAQTHLVEVFAAPAHRNWGAEVFECRVHLHLTAVHGHTLASDVGSSGDLGRIFLRSDGEVRLVCDDMKKTIEAGLELTRVVAACNAQVQWWKKWGDCHTFSNVVCLRKI